MGTSGRLEYINAPSIGHLSPLPYFGGDPALYLDQSRSKALSIIRNYLFVMHHSLVPVLALLGVASKTFAAPAVIPLEATKTYTLSGDLRGPTTLRGYDESYPFPTENTHPDKIEYAPGQKLDEPEGGFLDFDDIDSPQPLRGNRGGTIASNRNIPLEKQHPDSLAPPTTDKGTVAQLEWPLGLSHVKYASSSPGVPS